MRRFKDLNGAAWDVVLGRASWGTYCALFVPLAAAEAVRETALPAVSAEQAESELENMNDARLQQLLDASSVKEG